MQQPPYALTAGGGCVILDVGTLARADAIEVAARHIPAVLLYHAGYRLSSAAS